MSTHKPSCLFNLNASQNYLRLSTLSSLEFDDHVNCNDQNQHHLHHLKNISSSVLTDFTFACNEQQQLEVSSNLMMRLLENSFIDEEVFGQEELIQHPSIDDGNLSHFGNTMRNLRENQKNFSYAEEIRKYRNQRNKNLKSVYKNFLLTIKRSLYRISSKKKLKFTGQFSNSATSSISEFNHYISDPQIKLFIAKVFLNEGLVRQLQQSRLITKFRTAFMQKISYLKKAFISGRLTCL